MKGRVKWFNPKKGFGFITSEDKKDFFVHHTQVKMDGYRVLRDGQQVEFEAEQTDKGMQAVNVIPGEAPKQHHHKREGGAKHHGSR